LVLLGGFCATEVKADTVAFTAPGSGLTTVGANSGSVNLGIEFTADSTFMVDALGFYDGSFVTGSETVGLYNSVGTLLASATVALGGSPISGYLFQSIAPVTLTSGSVYTVEAFVATNGWTYGSLGTASPNVTFDSGEYAYATSMQFPTNASGLVYYGPNFEIVGASGAPEPGSFGLLLSVAVLTGCLYFRKTWMNGGFRERIARWTANR